MKPFRCLQEAIARLLGRRPPRTIPPALLARYTLGGKVPVTYAYDDSSRRRNLHYTTQEVDAYLEKARKGQTTEYGTMDGFLAEAVKAHPIAGKTVAVIGSERPRYEAFCLAHGARPTTIEYSTITTDDSRLEILKPSEVFGTGRTFDVAISLSTYEHSGLGRYGDPLDPDGDLTAMRELKTLVAPGGLLFLAVPIGRDALVFNLHRIYGRERLPLLHNGWEVLSSFGFKESELATVDGTQTIHQPVFVLRNTP